MPRYRFSYADDSAYGMVVKLLKSLSIDSGLIVDLGCGWSPLSSEINRMGLGYLGLEIDHEAIEERSAEGVDVRFCDLTDHVNMPERIQEHIGDQQVACVVMTDVLEHIPNADPFVEALARTHKLVGFPPLIISMPNVGHVDLAAKLLAGRWDVRPSGLLDDTHVSFYTESRFLDMLARHGFRQIAASDFSMDRSDQAFPAELAPVSTSTPLGQFVRHVRSMADDHSNVNQFVRAFSLTPVALHTEDPAAVDAPFLSVIMRTQGKRPGLLVDALTSLAAQTNDDFQVELVVHTDSKAALDKTKELVSSFDAGFAHRVRVHQVSDGGRSRPLNVGLHSARGRYVAFLDDDDMVFSHWVEAFAHGAEQSPGVTIRALAADQQHSMIEGQPSQAVSACAHDRATSFDLITHLHHNETPICAFALPLETVRGFRIDFDERLPVVEDWDLLVRTAILTGVHDLGEITSLYRRWTETEDSSFSHPQSSWIAAREMVIDKLDSSPILLPKGSARRLVELYEQDQLHRELGDSRSTIEHLERHIVDLEAHLDLAQGQVRAAEERPLWRTVARRTVSTLGRPLKR